MSGEAGTYRKLTQYEWTDATDKSRASVCPPPSVIVPLQRNVYSSAMACSERKAYLIGGYDPHAHRTLRQVAEWDLHSRQWSRLMDLPEPLSEGAAVVLEDMCLVWGGWNGLRYSGDLWLLSTGGAEAGEGSAVQPTTSGRGQKDSITAASLLRWERLPPRGTRAEQPTPAPSARCNHAMVLATAPTTAFPAGAATVSLNDDAGGDAAAQREPVAYLFGGFDGTRRLNDVWRLWLRASVREREAVWERLVVCDGVAPAPRDAVALAFDAARERLYVFGGFATTLMNDLYALELRDGAYRWVSLATTNQPGRREGCVATVEGSYLVLCMGKGEDHSCYPQLLQLSLLDLRWSCVAVEQAQELLGGRRGYVACCGDRNRRILVYGGGDAPHLLNSMVEVELEKIDPVNKKK